MDDTTDTRQQLTRRRFLQGATAVSGAAVVGAAAASRAEAKGKGKKAAVGSAGGYQFLHGVASGDPLPSQVILWTRVTPDDAAVNQVDVEWAISTNLATLGAAFTPNGSFSTSRDLLDFTVKIDAAQLLPATTYYYRFRVTGTAVVSPIGRTRTAPQAGAAVDRLRFAVVACAGNGGGALSPNFVGYRQIAQRADLDLVVHTGDYIYEYMGGAKTSGGHLGNPAVSLSEYRGQYSNWRLDPHLQEMHRQHPVVAIWDDHEVADGAYATGAGTHYDNQGDYQTRKGRAVRAYFEWLPIRGVTAQGAPGAAYPVLDAPNAGPNAGPPFDGLAPDGNGRIYRGFSWGSLLELITLDTRLAGRVVQVAGSPNSAQQTILGAAQRTWLLDELTAKADTATWKLIAQQVTFMPVWRNGWPNPDSWNGYRYDRQAVLARLQDRAPGGGGAPIGNVVILSGDIHATIAGDVPLENPNADGTVANPAVLYTRGSLDGTTPSEGSLAVEYCCNAIRNPAVPGWVNNKNDTRNNPHLHHVNDTSNGYLLLDITPQRVQGEWYYHVPEISPPIVTRDATILVTPVGQNQMIIGDQPSEPKSNPPAPAP